MGIARFTGGRGFVTCSARGWPTVAPLLREAERLLIDGGWRTRLPRRAGLGRVEPDDRARLREESYRQVERSDLMVHVPAARSRAGQSLHRELNHAVKVGVPVVLLHARDFREAEGLELPAPERLQQLRRLTSGELVEQLRDLLEVAARLARP